MTKKIIFLTTAHSCFDDRIYYHQAITLNKQGYAVIIASLSTDFIGIKDNIKFESHSIINFATRQKKIDTFISILSSHNPDLIICSEPLPVFAAHTYKKTIHTNCTIVYDITEWYPSKKQLRTVSFPKKIVVFFSFLFINILAGKKTDAFIFGEKSKKFPFSFLFPRKPNILLPYFPDKQYIYKTKKEFDPQNITLCYTGRISKEDGIENFFNAVALCINRNPQIAIHILIIGAPKKKQDIQYFDTLLKNFSFKNITIEAPKEFLEFTKSYANADICFDLREINFEYNHCLPIKLFYYAASGKPVIYTNLLAIRKFVPVHLFGFLVNPINSKEIAEKIELYISQPELYNTHSKNACDLYQKSYNWELISLPFCNFIHKLV